MALYRGSCKLAGLGRVPGTTYVTETEYNSLPSSKLTDGVNYGIYDDGSDNTITKFIKNGCEYCIPQGGTKYGYVDVLLVGGGGRGYAEYDCGGGGGGAGGFIECFCLPLSSDCSSYPVSIGCGGGTIQGDAYNHGGCSMFNGVIAEGGGWPGPYNEYKNGASGAGAAYSRGNAGTGISGQGYNGGSNCNKGGGGGGGAGGPGCDAINARGANGGIGKCSCMSGECQWYSGGGAGAGCLRDGCYGCKGGCGGGGDASLLGCPATYYGGGGGAGCCRACAKGCQGIAIIRYKKDGSCGLKMSGGGCRYECGDYYIHCFTNVNSTECFIPVFK